MSVRNPTACAVLQFDAQAAPGFPWVSDLAERRAQALPCASFQVSHDHALRTVIALDGSRILVSMTRLGEAGVVLVIAVGPGPGSDGPDVLRSHRGAFCRLLAEAVSVTWHPRSVDLYSVPGEPDGVLAELLVTRSQAPRPVAAQAPAAASLRSVLADPDGNAMLRAALYQPVRPAGTDGESSVPMRVALGAITSVVTVASLPAGVALMAWNGVKGPDMRMTAAVLAMLGLYQTVLKIPVMPLV